ncbi:FG-GAP-like repeat-containing protein [Candidatus Eisenbacteria bacterium]|uniref:FG-GAP-like repeat-containing protein n=1 Tax=Eiseniibacteriota bacterium TaxID=2212470 RepID=A0ABV6YIT6_UNCEI
MSRATMDFKIDSLRLGVLLTILTALVPSAMAEKPIAHSWPQQSPASHTALGISSALNAEPARTLSETAVWMVEPDQQYAWLGWQVATAGDVNGDGFSDVLVSGRFHDEGFTDHGEVWLFHGSAAGLSSTPDWIATSVAGDRFGCSIGTAGDVNADGYDDVVIGAYNYTNGEYHEGAAYLYLGSASGLEPTPAWSDESNQVSSVYGVSVGTAGDIDGDGYDDVLVGASIYDNGQTNEGRVYLYSGGPSGLSVAPTWIGEPDVDNAGFGYSVSTAGDVNADGYPDVIIGARYVSNPEHFEGRVYLYLGSAAGLATTPAWTYESNEAEASLGQTVGPAGDVNGDGYADVIVAAPSHSEGALYAGKAYVFLGNTTGLSSTPVFTTTGSSDYEVLGISVGTAGDLNGDGYADIFIGAPLESGEGHVDVYTGNPTGVGPDPTWILDVDSPGSGFGVKASTAGDVDGNGFSDLIVGAYRWTSPETEEGAAFLFSGGGDPPALTAAWTGEGDQASQGYGKPAPAGDVNGDGYSDFLIASAFYDHDEALAGKVELYLGSPAGSEAVPGWITYGDQFAAFYGTDCEGAGDVNGDGYSDVIVGAQGYDNGETTEGKVYLYHGSSTGPTTTPDWTAEGNLESAYFGTSVASAGDVNGDGFGDVIIGAQNYDNGQAGEGAAFVYRGSASGLGGEPHWFAESDQIDASLGFSVSSAGDVNGDGFSDVIVGIHNWDEGVTADIGAAWVYHGSPTGLSTTPDWQAIGTYPGGRFGSPVASAGDINGDGYGDVAVGARFWGTGVVGSVSIFYGSASGLDPNPGDFFFGSVAGELLHQTSSAGDVNGDGFGDVLFGGEGASFGAPDQGVAIVLLGSSGGLEFPPTWSLAGPQNSRLGAALSTAGDVNGDGFDEILVGAPGFDGGLGDEGAVFLYLGNDQTGSNAALALAPRQVGVGGDPIDLLGRSDAEDRVRLMLRGRTPAGRAQVRLEWGIEELGVPYGPITELGPWQNTGVPVVGEGSATTLDELATGLMADTLYRWRVRVACSSPYFPHSPWMSLSPTTPTRAQFRTGSGLENVTDWNPDGEGAGRLRIHPNPMRGSTTIAFELEETTTLDLSVYDVAGRRVKTVTNGEYQPGNHTIDWDTSDDSNIPLAAGLYFVRIEGARKGGSACVIIME